MLDLNNEVINLKEMIKNGSALYYYRATPFTEHGEFNYNGALKDGFFFQHMFSRKPHMICYQVQVIRECATERV